MRRAVGFTLIEVVVAFFIFSACAGAILLGLMLSMSHSKETREQIMAQMLASSVIDELRAHRYGSDDPLPGWSRNDALWTRTVSVPAVIGGLASPSEFELSLDGSATANSQSDQDIVGLTVAWTESRSGAQKLNFEVPMAKGWNVPVQRGTAPGAVGSNWHSPAKYTIPSEPSYKIGDHDTSVDPDVPDPNSIINDKTQHLQDLLKQLNEANSNLLAAQGAVADDNAAISDTQAALSQAQAASPPDQTLIKSLNDKLTQQQGQLAKDQGDVTKYQGQVTDLQKQITADGGSPS